MIIAITPERCQIQDVDDCTRLHVTADGLDDVEVGAALAHSGLGCSAESSHVWLAIDELRAAARTSATIPHWDTDFDAMITFARSKDWLDATGERVAAHLERSAS